MFTNPRSKHTKDSKYVSQCLTPRIIRSGSRVKFSNQGNGVAPSLYPGVVATDKGAFGLWLKKVNPCSKPKMT